MGAPSLNIEIFNTYADTIKQHIKKNYRVEVCIISLGGSFSVGLSNSTSDLDFYLLYRECEERSLPAILSIMIEKFNNKVDIMSLGIESLLEEVQVYSSIERKYPTYLHRDGIEQRKNAEIKKDITRDDFRRGLIYRTILSEYVWTDKEIMYYFELFHKGLKKIDIVDFYYTRARGNYDNYICNQSNVLCRKYLYTIHEVIYCLWIIKKKTLPPMNMKQLLEEVTDNKIMSIINELLLINSQADKAKEKSLVKEDKVINSYIAQCLQHIEGEIEILAGDYFS